MGLSVIKTKILKHHSRWFVLLSLGVLTGSTSIAALPPPQVLQGAPRAPNNGCTPATGTSGPDDMHCSGAVSGWINLYGDDDNVTLNGTSGYAIYWLDESIKGNPATDGNDIFIADNSDFSWVFGFGGDDSFNVNDSTFSNLYADTNPNWVDQRGDDTIIIEDSVSDGWILGGNDSDSITIKNSRVSFVASGYSDILSDLPNYIDYTPYDGDDTIMLDNVDFGEPNYYYPDRKGAVEGGKKNDTITFINGGIGYNVTGGHGDDKIEIFDRTVFHSCSFVNDRGNTIECGIYGDEPYGSEPNAASVAKHGDDQILLHDGDYPDIVINGGDGSDIVALYHPVRIAGTVIDGGDDRSVSDGYIDQLGFEGWSGELSGSDLKNWEGIVLENGSTVSFRDALLLTGYESGTNPHTGQLLGLTVKSDARLKVLSDLTIDGNLNNDATVDLQADGASTSTTLTVDNRYSAQNGVLKLDVVLNDGSTNDADQLIVKADTSGTTYISINNVNGKGGQTDTGDNSGILLIKVAGRSEGSFRLDGTVEAGKYTYTLVKGSNGNWYLQSSAPVPPDPKPPTPDPEPPTPDPQPPTPIPPDPTPPDPEPPTPEPVPPVDHTVITAVGDTLLVTTYGSYVGQLPAPGSQTTCPGPFRWVLASEVEHGDVTVDENGSYSYVPEADYNGYDAFGYRIMAEECQPSNEATVVVTVDCASSQPEDTIRNASSFSVQILLALFLLTLGIAFLAIKKENLGKGLK